jgi:hypothetical protein
MRNLAYVDAPIDNIEEHAQSFQLCMVQITMVYSEDVRYVNTTLKSTVCSSSCD